MEAITSAHSGMAENEAKTKKNKNSADDIVLTPTNNAPKKDEVVKNYLFKLVKKKKGRTWLDNCCDNVPNPKKDGMPERIWLFNGATSIWESDLENIIKDKNRYDRARRGRDIVFIDGVLRVRSSDKLMLEFLRANTHNIGKASNGGGTYDFYEYDPQQEQQDRHKKQLIKIEMITKAQSMPIDKAKKLASFFGIAFVDEIGMAKSDEGIRTDLMILADNNPALFQQHMDSKEVEISYMVKRAILDTKIDLQGGNGNALWSAGKGLICKIPSNKKAYEYLTELAMTNSDEGRAFKEQLEAIVN